MSSDRRLRSRISGLGRTHQAPKVEAFPKKAKEPGAVSTKAASGASSSKAPPVKRKLAESKTNASSGDRLEANSGSKSKIKKVSDSEPRPGSSSSGSVDISQDQAEEVVSSQSPVTAPLKILQNELVLSSIAKKLPTWNLLSLRQTSTVINRNFVPTTQHKEIHLQNDPNRRYPGPNCLISKYTEIMESSASIPFQNYYIHDLGLGRPRDIEYFFWICGKTITRLSLSLDSVAKSSTVTMQSVRQILFEETPELRELVIYAHESARTFSKTKATKSTKPTKPKNQINVLKEIPKLRKLTLETLGGPPINGYQNQEYYHLLEDLFQCAVGLEYLSTNRLAGILPMSMQVPEFPAAAVGRLKYLQVWRLEACHLRLLIQLGSRAENSLQLIELDTAIAGHASNARNAEMMTLTNDFLVTQSRTLRILDIRITGIFGDNYDNLYSPRILVRLPRMESVYSLRLKRDDNWQVLAQCYHGTFESNFPRLKQLSFRYEDWPNVYGEGVGESGRVDIDQFAHQGVTNLKLQIGTGDLSSWSTFATATEVLTILPPIWPAISKLDLEFPPQVFKLLIGFFTLWPTLISLRVRLSVQTDWCASSFTHTEFDEILSGIPASLFTALEQEFKLVEELGTKLTLDKLRDLRSILKTQPGISDMEHLQEFVLDTNRRSFHITDIGGYMGFAMMPGPAVQHLALIYEDPNKQNGGRRKEEEVEKGNRISEECRSFIRSVFGLYAVVDL